MREEKPRRLVWGDPRNGWAGRNWARRAYVGWGDWLQSALDRKEGRASEHERPPAGDFSQGGIASKAGWSNDRLWDLGPESPTSRVPRRVYVAHGRGSTQAQRCLWLKLGQRLRHHSLILWEAFYNQVFTVVHITRIDSTNSETTQQRELQWITSSLHNIVPFRPFILLPHLASSRSTSLRQSSRCWE